MLNLASNLRLVAMAAITAGGIVGSAIHMDGGAEVTSQFEASASIEKPEVDVSGHVETAAEVVGDAKAELDDATASAEAKVESTIDAAGDTAGSVEVESPPSPDAHVTVDGDGDATASASGEGSFSGPDGDATVEGGASAELETDSEVDIDAPEPSIEARVESVLKALISASSRLGLGR